MQKYSNEGKYHKSNKKIINEKYRRVLVCLHRLWLYSHEPRVVLFPKEIKTFSYGN